MVLNSLPVNQAVGGDSWSAYRRIKTIKLKEELNYEKKTKQFCVKYSNTVEGSTETCFT